MRSSLKLSFIGFATCCNPNHVDDDPIFAKDHTPVSDPQAMVSAIAQLLDIVGKRRRVGSILKNLRPDPSRLIRRYPVQGPDRILAVDNVPHILPLNASPDNKIRK
jgi:hypothetical protein